MNSAAVTRRTLFYSTAAAALLQTAKGDDAAPATKMGIATTSFVDVPQ